MDELTPLRRAARAAKTRSLSIATYTEHKRPSDPPYGTFVRLKGSWTAAVDAAGLTPRTTPTPHSEQHVVDALKACYADLQTPVSVSRYRAWQATHPDQPNVRSVTYRGLEHCAALAGLPTSTNRVRAQRFSDDDILNAIRAASDATPDTTDFNGVSINDYDHWRTDQHNPKAYPAGSAIKARFGSWPKARDAALGRDPLAPLRELLAEQPDLTRSAYLTWAKSHPQAPSLSWLTKHHGAWADIVDAALATAPTGTSARPD